MKKTLLWLLLAAMLLSNTACGGTSDETTDASGENVAEETVAEEVVDPLAFLPENLNYDGQTITIMQGHAYACNGSNDYGNEVYYNFDDIEGGDIVAEAVYNRNVMVEEKLNLSIGEAIGSGWDTWTTELSTSLTAGDNTYDMINGAFPTSFNAVVQGLVHNLKGVTGLDPSNPWWDKQVSDVMTFGEGYYAVSGDINFYDNYSTNCYFFNYDLMKEYNLEIPYDAVREGTWTFDKMQTTIDNFYTDINGDGIAGREDIYGIVNNAGIVARATWGMGMNLIIKDEQGNYICNETEELFDVLSRIIDQVINNAGSFCDNENGGGGYAEIFTAGRALFSEDNFAYLIKARDAVEDHIGVIPSPKYDEKQEEYSCPINNAYCSVYTVSLSTDTASIGYVLDAMGAASVDTVTEAVIEKNCMVKATRDEDSADMIRIILDSASYPLETVTNWGDITTIMRQLGERGVNDYASTIASKKRLVAKYVENDMEDILALQ